MKQPTWQHVQQVIMLPFWAPVTYRQLQACIFHYLLCCGSVSPSSTYCLLAGSGVEGDIKFVFLPFRQSQLLSLNVGVEFLWHPSILLWICFWLSLLLLPVSALYGIELYDTLSRWANHLPFKTLCTYSFTYESNE